MPASRPRSSDTDAFGEPAGPNATSGLPGRAAGAEVAATVEPVVVPPYVGLVSAAWRAVPAAPTSAEPTSTPTSPSAARDAPTGRATPTSSRSNRASGPRVTT